MLLRGGKGWCAQNHGIYSQNSESEIGRVLSDFDDILTGVSATASVGSIGLEIGVPLTGVSAITSVGAASPTQMTVGATGQSATVSLGSAGTSPLYYKDVDITGNTSYTDIEHTA